MKNKAYMMMVIIMSLPVAAAFSDKFFIRTIGFMWGCLGWLVVINLWNEQKKDIKSDTLLQQHNKEAEELEKAEQEDPKQKIEEIMDEPPKPPRNTNPFMRR